MIPKKKTVASKKSATPKEKKKPIRKPSKRLLKGLNKPLKDPKPKPGIFSSI